MDIRATVGLNVLRIRRERNLSQEELSFRSGLTRAYLSGLEAGRRNPTIVSLSKLADALSVDLENLVRASKRSDADSK
ncbi:helix-turn-helix transcriptional regulator [Rhizobium sp. LC145]|uniref:helix-turn-helix domain-containing protein n=1 Tax=Rhizobium sp. LC145 TaxID=1120688 RepID=UPI0009E64292|nr:helix-turn-helix transcriptional regulator [Rhizobium sp. LC145]MDX3927942.1 helix-turn-helix transcriptional regulator [Shinella sp.]TKT69021.1 helix-turn-helix transcriptional regulator [Rhizobiaceae bacterium LC148]